MLHPSSHIDVNVRLDMGAFVGPSCHLQGDISVAEGARLIGGITLVGDVYIASGAVLEPGVCIAAPRPGTALSKDATVHIGAGAHIGAGTVLVAGVRVGAGAWVEPGTVVLRHVPQHAVVGGNPATISGYRSLPQAAPNSAATTTILELTPGAQALAVDGVALHRFAHIRDLRGDLTVGEFDRNVPFRPKRYFLVFDVPSSETRGEHAHKQCLQFLVCVAGKLSVVVDDGHRREEVLLDRPNLGLLIPAGIWAIQYKYSRDSALLVFASEHYDPSDYIRDYDEFLSYRAKLLAHLPDRQ